MLHDCKSGQFLLFAVFLHLPSTQLSSEQAMPSEQSAAEQQPWQLLLQQT